MPACFTICKIEAGRAILLSQEDDYELIEFPAKLLPKECEKVVRIQIENGDGNKNERNDLNEDLKISEVIKEFGVDGEMMERFKNEISSENFFKIESLGCTATILSWSRPFTFIFGPSILIENVILKVSTEYSEDFADFVLKGQKGIQATDTKLRINLPVDLKVFLIVKTSVGCFKSNTLTLSCKKFEDFSGIFLVTDLQSDRTSENIVALLEFIREQGGYISRQISQDQPITAVVTDSFDSQLFREGIENNLPVVSSTWLEALVSTREIPHFEDHLITRK